MHTSIRTYLRSAALVGTAAALTVAGVSLAQSGSGTDGPGEGNPRAKALTVAGPPRIGPQNLTYAEFHVLEGGEAKVIRLDEGEVTSVGDSSITIKENDGSDVTIPIDADSEVVAGPGKSMDVADLSDGQHVSVFRPEGGAAETILLPPDLGDLPTKAEILRDRPGDVHVFKRAGGAPALRGSSLLPEVGFAIAGPAPRRDR
jgi:hypothetical protein